MNESITGIAQPDYSVVTTEQDNKKFVKKRLVEQLDEYFKHWRDPEATYRLNKYSKYRAIIEAMSIIKVWSITWLWEELAEEFNIHVSKRTLQRLCRWLKMDGFLHYEVFDTGFYRYPAHVYRTDDCPEFKYQAFVEDYLKNAKARQQRRMKPRKSKKEIEKNTYEAHKAQQEAYRKLREEKKKEEIEEEKETVTYKYKFDKEAGKWMMIQE